MKRKIYTALAISALSASLFWGFVGNEYFKINQSFEIFASVFKEVSNNYVVEIDPEIMVRNGIDGMLSTLDPYTEYFTEEYYEDLDLMTNGNYTGFGFTIAKIDSHVTIVDIKESNSAFREGVRVGDRLLKIDSTLVINMTSDELKNYTRGVVGSKSQVLFLRNGFKDTLSFTLTREVVNLKNISFYDVIKNDIAYIKLDGFTKTAAGEVRNALLDMKRRTNISGIILDLRENPGGLLASAVGISELFVPKGSLIVTTRGKDPKQTVEYHSVSEPIDLTTPLTVLIDEGSASASEIVAGAIQDLDRGIIVGRRSFGKGLVQSVFDLPNNSFLKMTTSKYYTPSGRCIQKLKFGELYDKKEISQNKDTSVFKTLNGRKVYELTGILPDTLVTLDTLPDILKDLYDKNHIFNFATSFSSKQTMLDFEFNINDKVFKEFENYLKEKEYLFLSKSGDYVHKIEEIVSSGNFAKNTKSSLNSLKKSIEGEDKKEIRKHKAIISKFLRYEILRRFYPSEKLTSISFDDDKDIQLSLDMLRKGKVKEMLKGVN